MGRSAGKNEGLLVEHPRKERRLESVGIGNDGDIEVAAAQEILELG